MERVAKIKNSFASSEGFVFRELKSGKTRGELIYNPDMTDSNLVFRIAEWFVESGKGKPTLEEIKRSCTFIAEAMVVFDKSDVLDGILGGDACLIVDGIKGYLMLNVRRYDKRAVTEPPLSSVTHGPREGFIEDMKTNIGLLRRRIQSPSLAIKKLKIGKITRTDVAIAYISGIADERLIKRVEERLKSIDVDGVLDIQYLQPYLEERPFSMFNQTGTTEKPDIVAAKILEGRIAVFLNGTPMVMTVPYLFIESVQSSADYYQRFTYATFLRLLRMVSLGFAILLPGVFIALQKFHFTVLPLRFLMTLLVAINGIPFKSTTEVLFVIFLFEIIREAGKRTPQAVGMAMNIVGALVLGETAVRAGIVSSPAVMIVALSSLALYAAPDEVSSSTPLRVIFTLLGGLGGIYLLLIGSVYLVQYLVTRNGYGAPYLAPFAPMIGKDLVRDGIVRGNYLNKRGKPQSLFGRKKEGNFGKN